MAEPIVRELMRADRVEPAAFEALLRSIAAGSLARAAQPGPQRWRPTWFRGQIVAEGPAPAKEV